ncbi:MAG: PQQ-binding-like beta-propeller repeat protein [Planctomycetota bacterium]|nr:PQQ-binding-like beta-propeller repeat protein [Planctomycetota bacterium]
MKLHCKSAAMLFVTALCAQAPTESKPAVKAGVPVAVPAAKPTAPLSAKPTMPSAALHRVLLQGNDTLAILARDGSIEWEMKWDGIHDLHRLPNGHILVQDRMIGVAEIDPAQKKVVWSYDSSKQNGNAGKPIEVHSFVPFADDKLLIAESGPARLIEIDRAGKLLREVPLVVQHPNTHRDTRLVRRLGNGNVLVCHEGDGCVREYDGVTGKVVFEFAVPLFGRERKDGHGPEAFGNQCFGVLRLPSGNTLIATGNGHSVIEVNAKKEIVWEVHQDDLKGIKLAWATTLEVLRNGNYVLGNCHAGPGQPVLVEFEPKTKKVVWTLDAYERFGNSVTNSVLLDEESLR